LYNSFSILPLLIKVDDHCGVYYREEGQHYLKVDVVVIVTDLAESIRSY